MPKGRVFLCMLSLCAALTIGASASADAPRKSFGDVVAHLFADRTFVVSPTSLNVVLHIAKDASRGRTAAEIEPLLFEENLQAHYPTNTDQSLLNTSGVWISSGFPGRQAFNELLSRKYGATLSRVNFTNGEGEDAVEKWITRFSNGDLHGMPLDRQTEFVIANIQVFDGKWYKPFDPKNTKPDTFQGRSGSEPIQMMSENGTFYYAGARGETVALDYAGPYRILLFLPRNRTDRPLETFLRQGFNVVFAPVSIELPRLHVNTTEYLTEPLEQLGMRIAFGPDADFSPMLGIRSSGFAVMFQDVDLKIDEHGTVAKALTEMTQKLLAMPGPRNHVRFDRPFAFAIVRTGDRPVTLFEGQILDIHP